jgi:hypothetical protein
MKCVVCENECLNGRKRFCSIACQRFFKQNSDKTHYRRSNPKRPKQPCLYCEKNFHPRAENNTCCCAECRELYVVKKRAEKKKSILEFPKFWLQKPSKCKVAPPLNPLPTSNSPHKKEIIAFKKAGGKIDLMSPQLDGRTPDVNLKSKYGWAADTFMGFGFELDLMDQLIEFSESADEI